MPLVVFLHKLGTVLLAISIGNLILQILNNRANETKNEIKIH